MSLYLSAQTVFQIRHKAYKDQQMSQLV